MTETIVETPASVLKVLDHTGDSRLEWNPRNRDEVDAARAHFDTMKAKGYLAYRVDENNEAGEVIKQFDPNAREIIMSPQMVGG